MATLDERLLKLPFPLCVSPYAQAAEQHVRAWAKRFKMVRRPEAVRRFADARFGIYAGYVQADATRDNLNTYACWLAWLFLVNDQHGEGLYGTPQAWLDAVRHLRPILDTGVLNQAAESSPAGRGLADVLGHVYPRTSRAWQERFSRHCWDTLHAVTSESARRQRAHVPDVDEYIANRMLVSAGMPLFDLSEVMSGRELPDEIRGDPAYLEMTAAATDVMAWCNDISSLEKEEAAGEVDNFVLVLEKAEKLDRPRAVAAVARRVRRRVDDYLTADRSFFEHLGSRGVNSETRHSVDYCVRSMRHLMVGNLRWSQRNPRYDTPPPGRGCPRPPYVEDVLGPHA